MSVLRGILKTYADRKYAAEIIIILCGNMVQNCLKPTTPSRSTGSGYMVGATLLTTDRRGNET